MLVSENQPEAPDAGELRGDSRSGFSGRSAEYAGSYLAGNIPRILIQGGLGSLRLSPNGIAGLLDQLLGNRPGLHQGLGSLLHPFGAHPFLVSVAFHSASLDRRLILVQ
jgi:hypothetical protein